MMKHLIKLIRAQNIGEYGLTPAKCADLNRRYSESTSIGNVSV